MLITISDGREVDFALADASITGAFFVLGVRKSGSSLLNSICQSLARHNNVPMVDIGGTFFSKNVSANAWRSDPSILQALRGGHLYGGFREMPLVFLSSPLFQASPKILLVRDPRDALVSEYFSNAYSHSLPQQGGGDEVLDMMNRLREAALATSIDEFVLSRAPFMSRTILEYKEIFGSPRLRTFKYEDIIFDKKSLISGIVEHFGWSCERSLMDQILSWADIFPENEDQQAFVRKVVPGDHREKLAPATIAALDIALADAQRLLGYASP